uniref:Uncharacterized protein n=1 Tax=Arundo donax TaxID=35708 RepID=A0A0A8Y0V6_ARUDO
MLYTIHTIKFKIHMLLSMCNLVIGKSYKNFKLKVIFSSCSI